MSLTTALSAVAPDGHSIIVLDHVPTSAEVTALKAHIDLVSGPVEQRGAVAIIGMTDMAAAKTLAATINHRAIAIVCHDGSTATSGEIAAAVASALAAEPDRARPLDGVVLDGLAAYAGTQNLMRAQQEDALTHGVTPLEVVNGQVQIVRLISTMTTNEDSEVDAYFTDLTKIRTVYAIRDYIRAKLKRELNRQKITNKTLAKVRSCILAGLKDLEAESIGYTRNVQANAQYLTVTLNTADSTGGSVVAEIPADVVTGLHGVFARLNLI